MPLGLYGGTFEALEVDPPTEGPFGGTFAALEVDPTNNSEMVSQRNTDLVSGNKGKRKVHVFLAKFLCIFLQYTLIISVTDLVPTKERDR